MKYIIVGGGPAGLTLAYILAINNISITLIESNDQLGGSWNSQWIDDKYFSENAPRVMVSSNNMYSMLHHIGMTESDFANVYGNSFDTNVKMFRFLHKHFNLQDYLIFTQASIKYRFVKDCISVQDWLDESSMSSSGKKAMTTISILLCDHPENTNVCDLFNMFGFSPIPLRQMREPNKWHELIEQHIKSMQNVYIYKNNSVLSIIHNSTSEKVDGVVIQDNKTQVQNSLYADNIVLCTQSSGLSSILGNSNSIVQNNWLPYEYMKTWTNHTYYNGFGFQLHFKCTVDMPEDWCWSCMGDWTVIILPVSNWLKTISKVPDINTVWSCCIVDMNTKCKRLNKTANECSDQQEVVNECIRQIKDQYNLFPTPDIVTTSEGLRHINSKWESRNTGFTRNKYGNIPMKGNLKNVFALGCFTEIGECSVATMGKAIDATACFIQNYEPNLQNSVFRS